MTHTTHSPPSILSMPPASAWPPPPARPSQPSRSMPGCRWHRVNASPVPHLTSLYHFHRAGEYGDRSYPGNCGGNLIKDLLLYFKPTEWCSTR